MSTAYSCIHHLKTENMAAVEIESRGTRSEIKEQSENIKSLFGHFLSEERTCAKTGMKVKEKRKRNVRGVF